MLDRRHGLVVTLAALLGSCISSGCQTLESESKVAELPPIVVGADLPPVAGPELTAPALSNPIIPVAAEETSSTPDNVDPAIPEAPTGSWRPTSSATTADAPIPTGSWRALNHGSAPVRQPVVSSSWPLDDVGTVAGPVTQEPPILVNAQPEPATDLKMPPRKMPAAGAEPIERIEPQPAFVPAHPPVPREQARITLPPYVVDPPDVLLIESTQKLPDQPIRGQHLVRPDGKVSLGIYGTVDVAGLTLDQVREVVAHQLGTRIKDFDIRNLAVDVLAYNSKWYYVISDGGGYGEQVTRFPVTGNETVLDAISQVGGLGAVSSKKCIWVARTVGGHPGQVLPVDWVGITRGMTETNYQVMPNDRIYVKAKPIVTFDTALGRMLSPIERLLGITLLGASTVNEINGRTNNNNGTGR